MNEEQLRAILHSDMKLWDACAEENGERFLELPYGIGRVAISMEGIDDGAKRAAAVGSFGDYIRSQVEDKIGNDAVTARAQQRAADDLDASRKPPVYGGIDNSPGRMDVESREVSNLSDQETVATPNVLTTGPKELARQTAELAERIKDYESHLDTLRFQLKAGLVLLEMYNDAPKNEKSRQPSEG